MPEIPMFIDGTTSILNCTGDGSMCSVSCGSSRANLQLKNGALKTLDKPGKFEKAIAFFALMIYND